MNYLIIHSESNLITGIIASTIPPNQSNTCRAIQASESVLNKYYKLKMHKNRNGALVDAGELATVSSVFLELLN